MNEDTVEVLSKILLEYGKALRDDCIEVDGCTMQDEMECFSAALQGKKPWAKYTLNEWRKYLCLCLYGEGHWYFNCECKEDEKEKS